MMQDQNMDLIKEEILNLINISKNQKPNLFHLNINPTNRCNLNCPYCISQNRDIDFSKELSDEKYIKSINEAINLGLKHLKIIGGGEALIRNSLMIKIMQLLSKNKQIYSTLQTNGTLFSDSLIKLMVEANLDELSISIESADEKKNDFLRGKGTYKKIIFALERFNYWKEELNSNKPEIIFTPVLCSTNYDNLDKLIILAKKYNVCSICLQPLYLVINNNFCQKIKLNSIQRILFEKSISKLEKLAEKNKINQNFKDFSSKIIKNCETQPGKIIEDNLIKYELKDKKDSTLLLKVYCFDFWNFLGISPYGEIQLCLKEVNYGFNIKKDKLKDVWYSKNLIDLRKKFLCGEKLKECDICCPAKILETQNIKNEMINQAKIE